MEISIIENWLVAELKKIDNSLSLEFIKKNKDQNIFNLGMIDSMSTIILVEKIEAEFKILLTDKNFQDERFNTVEGLANIIYEEKNEL